MFLQIDLKTCVAYWGFHGIGKTISLRAAASHMTGATVQTNGGWTSF